MPTQTVQDASTELELRRRNVSAYVRETVAPQLMQVLPRHIPEERMVRLALAAVRREANLLTCTPLSLAGALMTAATLGLEPNTPEGLCFLVPYKNKRGEQEASLVVGYQGYTKLFWQHPLAADIWAESVYSEDTFSWAKGTSPFIDHHPHPEKRAEGSEPTHYYAVAELTTGRRPFVVLTAQEVKTLRQGKVGPKGDIADPQRWMERKTAIRQLVKLLPKSALLARAAQVDETSGTDLYRAAQAERVTVPDPEEGPPIMAELPGGPVEDPPAGGEGL